jgi:predicted Zn-dependent protease
MTKSARFAGPMSGRHRGGRVAMTSVIAGILLTIGACAANRPHTNDPALFKSPLSDDQEDQIGAQVKAALDGKRSLDYVEDETVVTYVRDIAKRVVNAAGHDWSDFTWQVFVVDDSRTVNAFATPGGYLYITTGLLAAANDEAELAGVLGHVAGHMAANHPLRNLIAAYGVEPVAALSAGQNPGLLAQLASTIATTGLMLANTTQEETEADELGARFASRAGYDLRAMGEFFQIVQNQQATLPGAQAFLSDHPTVSDRLTQLQKYADANRLGGSNRGKATFAPVKERIVAHAAGPSGAAAVQALSQAPPPPPRPTAGIRPASSKTTTAPRRPVTRAPRP